MGGFIDLTIVLAGFAGSVLAAVRFHEIPGAVLESFGLSQARSDTIGGFIIFVPLIVATAMIGSRTSRAMFKPGLFTANRAVGAAFGALLALTIVVVGLLFARSARLPFGIGRLVETSTIAPRVLRAAAPGVRYVDRELGLDLCGGRFARTLPEICRNHA